MSSFIQTAALVGTLVASVAAHGTVSGAVVGNTYFLGYSPEFQFDVDPPIVIGWSSPEDLGNGFIDPANYTTPEIICHLGATPAGTAAVVPAGGQVELQWTPWPSSHHGPVIDYLAKCPGSCSNVDKTTLEFFKIDAVGLISEAGGNPGVWASDQLIANNNSWVVTIPPTIAPGNYVLRHEIIALHAAGSANGAQNYPQCINLEITGSGTDNPTGVLGTALYNANDPGVLINIYQSLSTYIIPGPTLYSGAISITQSELSINNYAPVTSGPPGATAPPYGGTGPVTTPTSPSSTSTSKASPSPSSTSTTATSKPTSTFTTTTSTKPTGCTSVVYVTVTQ